MDSVVRNKLSLSAAVSQRDSISSVYTKDNRYHLVLLVQE